MTSMNGTSTWGLSVAPLLNYPVSPSPSHLLHRAVMEDMTGPPWGTLAVEQYFIVICPLIYRQAFY